MALFRHIDNMAKVRCTSDAYAIGGGAVSQQQALCATFSGGQVEKRREASNFNCTFFPVNLLSDRARG